MLRWFLLCAGGLFIFPGHSLATPAPTGNLQSAICDLKFHKFHVTNSQIEYNQTEQSAEIIVRVFADDFQSAISRHSGREVKLDRSADWKDKAKAALILSYLNENFVLKNKAGRQVKLSWVGMEGVADMFWIYVEGKMTGGMAGAQLKNRLHCELFDDQVNVVNTKFEGKQVGLMFEPKDGFKSITEKS
ncbi:MAG TPA: DUF6702 family protein [Blastocatellia bacterium]|nr:DUF6702 family protein [Blastocatellia bacterium]